MHAHSVQNIHMDVIRLGLLGNEDGDPFALVKAAACYRLELLLASRKLGRQVKGRIRLSRICEAQTATVTANRYR